MCLFIGTHRRLGAPKNLSHVGVSRTPKSHKTKGYQIAKMPTNPMKLQPVHALCQRTLTTRKKQLLSKLHIQKSGEDTSHSSPFLGGKHSLTGLATSMCRVTTLNQRFKQTGKGTILKVVTSIFCVLSNVNYTLDFVDYRMAVQLESC